MFDVDVVFFNFGQSLQNFLIKTHELIPNIQYSPKQWFLKGRFNPELIENFGFKNIVKQFEKAGLFNQLEEMPNIELNLQFSILNFIRI